MFHRVKIEDQAKEQPAPQKPQQPQQQQQSFFSPREEPAPAPEQRQRNFIQASESIVNQNTPMAPVRDVAPIQQQAMQQQPQAPVAPQAPAPVQQQPQAQTTIQPQAQQPAKKEAAPMNTNTARDENNQDNTAEQAQTRPMGIPGGYQAANQPGRSAPGGYPGAYPGYAVKPATTNNTQTNISSGATLTIGRGITLSGEIEACEHLVVEGNVEAALKGAKLLDIAETGTFYGAVEIEKATIAGRFEGDLTVNGRLTVRSTGSITGTISYKELEVESGAVLEGRITASKSKDDSSARKAGKDASNAAKSSREFNAQQETAEQGLFAGKAAE